MKKINFSIVLLLISFSTFAQKTKLFSHEIGVDLYPIAKNIFSNNSNGWGLPNPIEPNSFMYRLTYKSKYTFRSRFTGDFNNAAAYKHVSHSNNKAYIYDYLPTINNTHQIKAGLQYNQTISEKIFVYSGADIIAGKVNVSAGSNSVNYDTSGNYVYVTSNGYGNTQTIKSWGGSLFSGIGIYLLKKNILFSYEMAADYIRTKEISHSFSSSNYQVYFNNKRIQDNPNTYETDLNPTTRKTIFRPVNIFMLSFRF